MAALLEQPVAPKTPEKDPTGAFFRLLFYLRETEHQYLVHKQNKDRRLLHALQKQVDKFISEYFAANPHEERPRSPKDVKRMGVCMRQLRELRRLEDDYWRFRTKECLERLFPLRFHIDGHMDAYWLQYPDEAPDKIKKLKA